MISRSLFLFVLGSCVALADEPQLHPAKVDGVVQIPVGTELQIVGPSASPTAIAMSEQGELLVTETHRFGNDRGIDDNRRRRYWLLDDSALRTTADRVAMYEKWSERHPMESYTAYSEKIRRMVPGADGVARESNIWADGFNDVLDGTIAGIEVIDGKVYVACIPHLWLMEDKDGDGKSDERTSLQDGFGVHISLSGHDMNGFALGPDGRVYGTMGDRGMNLKTKEGKEYAYPHEGAVFRFDPDGSDFEVIHSGLRNPKEIAFDDLGNPITVDNNSDQGDKARVVYIVDGGESGWRIDHQLMHSFHKEIGLEKRPMNRWMDERMWETRNGEQPAFMLPPVANHTSGPSGLAYHPGTGLDAGFAGQFLVCDYRGGVEKSEISSFSVAVDGAGMKFENPGVFNRGVTPTDVMFGYDGYVYVTDFGGGWASHDEGRVYRVVSDEPNEHTVDVAELFAKDIRSLDQDRLVKLLSHPDLRVRTRAHIALADLGESGVAALIDESAEGKELRTRLHATWGLWVAARRGASVTATEQIAKLLEDNELEVRAQAARAYGEAVTPAASKLIPLLKDGSPRVRFFAALSLARLGDVSAVEPAMAMLLENNANDLYLRHAGVQVMIHCGKEADIAMLSDSPDPELRLAAVIALRHHRSAELPRFLDDKLPKVRDEAIRAIHDQQMIELQPALMPLVDQLLTAPDTMGMSRMMVRRLVHAAFRVGGVENAVRLAKLSAAENLHDDERAEALRLLSMWEKPFPVDQSTGRYAPLAERSFDEIRDPLAEALLPVLQQDGPTLAPALQLVSQYGLKIQGLTVDRFNQLATNTGLDPQVRATAVRSLVEAGGASVVPQLEVLSKDGTDVVRVAALEGLSSTAPEASVPRLVDVVNDSSVPTLVRQRVWAILGGIDDPKVKEALLSSLNKLATPDGDDECAIEILELAEASDAEEVKAALVKYHERAEFLPLGEWHVAEYGGDVENGWALFQSHGAAQCMRCHVAGHGHDVGGDVGPNLGGIGLAKDREYLVRAMIDPGADVADGFGSMSLMFPNGAFLSGVLEKETDDAYFISNGDRLLKVSRDEEFTPSEPVSAMPNMTEMLTKRELRDVTEFLTTMKDEGDAAQLDVSKAEDFDPESAPKDVTQLGESIYNNLCATCHQPDGKGNIAFPPLEGSEWLKLDVASLARMQLNGLMGPITVAGKEYNSAMPPNAALSDEEIAAVIQFVRTKWGGDSSSVDPAVVEKVRAEGNVGPWTVDTLMAKAPPESITRLAMARGELSDEPMVEEQKDLGMSREKDYNTDLLMTLLVMSGLFVLAGAAMARN